MPPHTGTLLIPRDIVVAWGVRPAEQLARCLEQRLNQPVVLCWPDRSASPYAAAIESLINAGARRVVALPVGIVPLNRSGPAIQSVLWAIQKWPDVRIQIADPVSWLEWSNWLRVSALEAANQLLVEQAPTAILIVGRDGPNTLVNADLARLAHLVQETSPVEAGYAFLGSLRPGISEAIRRLANAGARHVIVVPWLISDESGCRQLAQVTTTGANACGVQTILAEPSLTHPALMNVLVTNHCAASLNDLGPSSIGMETNTRFSGSGRAAGQEDAQLTPDEVLGLQDLERRINELLPPEYEGAYERVSPKSMGSAPLKFDETGAVAWGEIWTSFCDLALAGGPPHRGTLLEAVTAEEALANSEAYQRVVAEIERGITLVTSLPVVTSRTPGWVGIRCESEEMAIWLMRAMIVENIMVRREGDVLFLPAGPHFTVRREIKNVITAVAKTVHYWSAHLIARRQPREGAV